MKILLSAQLLCAVVIVRAFSDEFSVSIPSGGDDSSDVDELMDYQAAKDREFTDSILDVLDDDEDANEDAEKVYDFTNNALSEESETLTAQIDADGMIEIDDMIISPDMFRVMFPSVENHPNNSDWTSIHKRAAITSKKKFWPKGRVIYAYSKKLRGSTAKIRAAMDEWEKYTCIRFQYRNNTIDEKYVLFRTKFDKDGKMMGICSSALGYTRKGPQYLNLAAACFGHKTILHEIGHTLGLIHEHQHPARDKYVTINWANVNPKKAGNFRAKKGVSDWGLPYDPTSVMHYRAQSFKMYSCKKPCFTIESKEGKEVTNLIGKAKHLSKKSDIPIINKMYQCDASVYITEPPKDKNTVSKPDVKISKPDPSTVIGF